MAIQLLKDSLVDQDMQLALFAASIYLSNHLERKDIISICRPSEGRAIACVENNGVSRHCEPASGTLSPVAAALIRLANKMLTGQK